MFGLFKSREFRDPQLGALHHKRGAWQGTFVGSTKDGVPLAIAGTSSAPDPEALAMARMIATTLPTLRPALEQALYEHYEPYADAVAAEVATEPADMVPRLTEPSQVWPHVTLVHVAVMPVDGALTLELGYAAAWDDDHTLGARFRAGRLVELSGSVLPP